VIDHLLSLHGWAAVAVVFLLPALESSAFVGFVFPGELAVLLGGVLAYQGRVSLAAVLAAAVLGAVAGDSVGYLVGRRWGRRVLDGTLGRLVRRDRLDRAEAYLAERGGKAVFLGRFTAALRVLVPGLAGMAGMDYRMFAVNNVAGGAVWATGFVLLGYGAGGSWRTVEHVARRAGIVVLALVVLAAATTALARWVAGHRERVEQAWAWVVSRPAVVAVRVRYGRQLAYLSRRLTPGTALGLALSAQLALLAAAVWGFGAVVQDVVGGDDSRRLDLPVLRFVAGHREPWMTTLARWVSVGGSARFLVAVVVALTVVSWVRARDRRPPLLLAAAVAGASMSSSVVKHLLRRPRPPVHYAAVHVGGYGFPSGHATAAAAFYAVLAALLVGATRPWGRKVAAAAACALAAVFVGLSRVYLGVHWMTDVIGGWTLGGLWAAALLVGVRLAQPVDPDRGGGDDALLTSHR
jgi:membrane protein DedA with SNARE-associated domain/membrane-associated phospholipid phosphatase